jgi:VCBS repeat-containing protein
MKMQTIFLALAIMAVMSGVASAQYANSVSLTNVSVSPNPVVAGGNATIRFQLYNTYNYWLYGTTLQPTGSYPLLNVSPLNSHPIGVLDPGLNARYYNYTMVIPNTTPSGTYTLTFTATYMLYSTQATEIASSSMPVSFYVQGRPTITVQASNPQPSTLYTGYNQTLSLSVQNTGYGTARNVSVTVSGSRGLNVLSSVKSFFISNLTRGSEQVEPILISANGTGNPYLIINTTYHSARLNKRFSSTQRINISVAPSAQFTINSEGPSPGIGATDVPVNFRITNTGTSPAEQLQLNLETPYPITPIASSAYVNGLQPGASTNVTFLVSIDTAGVPGNYPVTLYEQWKQPSGSVNQQFTGSNNYFVAVGETNSAASAYETYAIVIIVVIIILAIVYRRRSGKGKTKAKK